MINSQDIKKGTCIRMDGKLYFCIDFLHRKPGKGNTIMNVREWPRRTAAEFSLRAAQRVARN